MKRLIAAIIIFVIAASGAVTSNIYVSKHIDLLLADTQTLIDAAETEDKETATNGVKKLEESWDESQTFLHMFVIHREMNDIELNVYALAEYLEEGEWALFREMTVRIQQTLKHIEHSQQLTLSNVF